MKQKKFVVLLWIAAGAAGITIGCGSGGSNGSGGKGGQGGRGGSAGQGGSALGGGAGATTSEGGAGGGTSVGGGGATGGGGAAGGGGATGGGGAGGHAGAGGSAPVNCGAGGFIGSPGSLLSDGGFECPAVGAGSYVNYSTGQSFFGWMVVGAPGDASPLSSTYSDGVYVWTAHGGTQTLDLTGPGTNSATGVAQMVTTTPGTTYHLSFWVGNIAAPGTTWGASSTVNVTIDGVMKLAAVNTDGAGTKTLAWRQFTLDFVAAQAVTTIAFLNGDPSNDNSNILDDVVLN